jgi:hypothetical protein
MRTRRAFVVVAGLLAAGCGGGSPGGGGPSPTVAVTIPQVQIQGKVTQVHVESGEEGDQDECGVARLIYDSPPRFGLTFKNGRGEIVGLVDTTPQPTSFEGYSGPAGPLCDVMEISTYSIRVPREDFYEVEVSGHPGSTVRVSYAELESKQFELDVPTGSD